MGEAPSAFTVDDLCNEQRIESLDLHPGGQRAVCAVKSVQRADDDYQTHLWLLPLDGGPSNRLTFVPSKNSRPRWSPGGDRIAFLSDRHGGPQQVFLMPADGGEARQITRFAGTVIDLAWRPDGRQLALVCAVNVDPDQRVDGTREIDLQRPIASATAPEVVWRLPYKMDGSGYVLGARLQIVLLDIESQAATPLTRGDCDVGHLAWSRDGRRLAYTRGREDERESHCTDVWMLDLDGPAQPFPEARRLTTTVATASWPAFSPDGSTIAFMGAENGGDAIMRLWAVDVASGTTRLVADEDVELFSNPLFWDADGRRLRAMQAWRGVQRIVCIQVDSGEVTPLVEPAAGHVSAMAVGEVIAYVEEGMDHPIEAHRCNLDGGQARRISDFNGWWRQRHALKLERRRFEVPDGEGGTEQIEGWLLLREGEPSPRRLLVDVHGGPASYVALQFPTTPYWQVLASQGWAILALNAVGSASYGRRFSERLRKCWGRLDLPQYRAAIAALRREGLVDDRVAIAGSSYGGYFSAYATGNCEDFRASVVSAPVGNLETHYGTSDSGYYADPFSMEGKPDANRELMIELSPMAHIGRGRTPTLFLQGKDDERCPKCQSEEMFVKLKRSGTPSEMVLYPGGDHHTLGQGRPSHRLDGHARIVDWLNRWVEVPLPAAPGEKR
ncbi:S9 family peptidase [Roseateles sp.]|uniref:S9 family peptidase n=1 Tax=Roseateles sp. TaxID=1971397 RepID=UPI0031DD6460